MSSVNQKLSGQPQTKRVIDSEESFERVKNTVKNIMLSRKRRKENACYALDVPEEVGIQITYRCNLRCKHCFQLGEDGFFLNYSEEMRNAELDVSLIKKILDATQLNNSKLYIWGGEPFVHRQWDEIARLLIDYPRWIVLCTNGLTLRKKIHTLLDVSHNLVLLVSLEGFEDEQNSLRGKGTYEKLIENLEYVFELKRKGIFKGLISLHLVISDAMASRLYEFMAYWDKKDIDTIYYCFPWYISKETTRKMDAYFSQNFSWLTSLTSEKKSSWYGYSYHLSPDSLATVKTEFEMLRSRVWNARIRFNPPIQPDEFDDFIQGSHIPGCNISNCYAISNRMDVLADGSVTTCQLFPEFSVENLYEKEVLDVWKGEKYNRVRKIIDRGLMPICSKCALLYLNSR